MQWWLNKAAQLESHLLPCPFKMLTGCDCPACGTQRSILCMLKGDFRESLLQNPAGMGGFLFVFVLVASRSYNATTKQRIRWATAALLIGVMILHWLLKIFHGTCCS
jgi:hypothetical protein